MTEEEAPTSYERGKLPKTIIDKWVAMSFRVFTSLMSTDEPQMMVSVPQLISTMAFLLGNCDFDRTKGLRDEFTDAFHKPITCIQTKELVESTCEFLKRWNYSLMLSSRPGHVLNVQRAMVHPEFTKTYSYHTMKNLGQFEVELNIFDGVREVNDWLARFIKIKFRDRGFFQLWRDDSIVSRGRAYTKKKQQFMNTLKTTVEEANASDSTYEMKVPVLCWASHAIVAIPPDIIDTKRIYFVNDVECLKMKTSGAKRLEVTTSDNDWKTFIVPTASNGLLLHFIYDMDACKQVTLEKLERTALKFGGSCPTLVCKTFTETTHEEIYIPTWNFEQMNSLNIGSHFAACFDMNAIFYLGGFGDLAPEDASPSCASQSGQLSNIQHFDVLSILNAPESSAHGAGERETKKDSHGTTAPTHGTRKESPELHVVSGEQTEVVSSPYVIMLWDTVSATPVYFARISSTTKNQSKEVKERKKLREKCIVM
ncbi:unnamed protein product [Caenorhabditis auriculariae]|uniref:Serpin domain-containing protein n=1 Tax=Caenorhabditis auriculariae TaxID=2777116 RepID=A0A8S1GYC0_9PELO|nr:unnamed protein product [Caenorhabditis auriculariae]